MVKQGKSTAYKTRMVVVGLSGLALLLWLGCYLWTYDYRLPEAQFVSVSLRICDGTEFYRAPGVWACFTFVNTGQSRVRLVETQALTPLYSVNVFYQDSGGSTGVPPMPHHGLAGQKSFDPNKDSVVELPPGSALSHLIPLSQIYDLRREGKYALTVAYKPGAWAFPAGQTLADLKAYDQELQRSTGFQLPFVRPSEKAEKRE